MTTNYLIPPDDPVIINLPDSHDDPATDLILKHVKTEGFTTPADLARKLDVSYMVVDLRLKRLGLVKRAVRLPLSYYHSRGYTHGRFEDFTPETVTWLALHAKGDESFIKTADRLLRGDAKPNPRCGCSFCLRSRG